MRGRVLGVDARTGDGLVAGDDGRRYRFAPEDWAARGEPAIGIDVDFEADRDRALSLFPLVPSGGVAGAAPAAYGAATPAVPRTDRNKYVAAVLAFLLGPLGLHRFYTGRTGSGIAMLVLSVTIIGLAISVPWSWIDMVRYLVMSDREFARRYPRD